MKARIVRSAEEFERLQPAWDELHRADPRLSPFQKWIWSHAWWREFGPPGALRLVVVEDEGGLVGVAPLYRRPSYLGLPIPHLAFVGQRRTDYLDFVVRRGAEREFAARAAAALTASPRDWRFLDLKDFPEGSPHAVPFADAMRETLPLTGFGAPRTCVRVGLPGTWDAYFASLEKRMRRHIGYDRRLLARHFRVDMRVHDTPEGITNGFQDLVTVYRARWNARKGATRFEELGMQRFESTACRELAASGWCRLYVLHADDRPVACLTAFVREGRACVDTFAHDPEFHRYSVGNVLLGMAIEDGIGRGWHTLDLTRGGEAYKYRWGGKSHENLHLQVFGSALAQAAVSSLERAYRRVDASATAHRLHAAYRRLRFKASDAALAAGGLGGEIGGSI